MKHWKIHQRLLASFALVIVLLVGLSAYSVFVTRGIDATLSANSSQNAVIQRAAIDFRGSVHDRAIALRDASLAPDAQALQVQIQEIERLAQLYTAANAQLTQVLQTQQVPAEVAPLLQDIAQHETHGLRSAQQLLAALREGQHTAAADVLWHHVKPQYTAWLASINRLIDFEAARIAHNNTHANAAATNFGDAMLLITLLAVAASITAAVLLARNLTRELGAEPYEVRAVMQALQQGHLTVAVPLRPGDRHSVMAAVHAMQQRFHALVAAVHHNITALRATGGEIAAGNAHLDERTAQTQASLRLTSQELGALTETVQHSAQAATQAESLAHRALQAADHGGQVMQQVVGTMQDIAHSSHQIEDIIGVIDGIAFQTNLLALNAAVEAARAGEQGRGFAVVAGEVRALAGRSAAAAQQIKALIASSVERVSAGEALVGQAGSAMQGIVEQVQRVHRIITDMGQATQVQNQGIDQLNTAVAQLDTMTQQNASLVSASRHTSAALQAQASALAQLAAAFTVHPAQAAEAANPRACA